jgi:periplasmic protein TonB
MGYQALLFCPDEKTARTVTQVLSELDFTVVPCTEPFGAVKKLMGEHFDAVVVDCDNEQNATLLFKSARNTPNNQSSLAVAVVEGQAGVAKAFRIGANLVLTRPINVEQAKGTLRVARGLLRKNDGGKPAAPAATTIATPVAPVPAPPRLVSNAPSPKVTATRPLAPVTPVAPRVAAATASIPTEKPAAQPRIVGSASGQSAPTGTESFDASEKFAAIPAVEQKKTETATIHSEVVAPSIAGLRASSGFGSASAPAPAREPKPSVSEDKASSIAEPETQSGKVNEISQNTPSNEGASTPAPAFTFGGNVSSEGSPESARGASKKSLVAVAAVVLIVAGGAAWMQWIRSSGAATPFTQVAAPVTTPAAVPHVTSSAGPAGTSSATSTQPSTPDSAAAPQSTEAAKTSSDSAAQDDDSAESTPVHSSKGSAKSDSTKASTPALPSATNKAPAKKTDAEPIVIKNDVARPAVKAAPIADAPAPSLSGIAPADNGGAIPNLMGGQSKAATPVLQTLTVSQGVSRGLLVKQPQPVYPASALRMHVEGAVELLATVSKNGDISAVKVLKGDSSLARAASDAVKQWKYKPYLLNGEPVEIQTQITVNFKLPR